MHHTIHRNDPTLNLSWLRHELTVKNTDYGHRAEVYRDFSHSMSVLWRVIFINAESDHAASVIWTSTFDCALDKARAFVNSEAE